jgi:DNA-binding response OmpR family regulator
MSHADAPSILLVDDDVDICRNLRDILGDLNYRVDIAHDGPTALRLIASRHYDLALLDLRMPGMDGLTLYREIKSRSAGTAAIIVTAFIAAGTEQEALAAGCWKVMTKPIDFPQLLTSVDEALGRPVVMVVDDDRDLCQSLWDVLRGRGYRVDLAHDAREAAEHLRDRSFHVVLIDLKLPDADGGEVYRLVREANPEARTVLITGARPEMEELVNQVLSEGADSICYKPFDVQELVQTVDRLVPEVD